ncbi:progressive ankylosis protein homolog B-like [Saccoglossus kowalevskii]|uniref:Progressive ankylosis protein homolog B-like n=1 Tax=Saccoglossus kowalevskii TaxID=10224 RepID=A0ABM0GJZ5_SACKO|nr:PREDICTED: progressive ankylosis protein homolog B-like [Saccoglossus kowalevskii]
MPKCNINCEYWPLIRFMLPLTCTFIAVNVAEQTLNRGLTSSKDATSILAIFGISYTLVKFANGSLLEFKHVGVVQVHSRRDIVKPIICIFGIGTFIILIALLISYTELGYYAVTKLYGLDDEIGNAARNCIFYLSIYPLIDGIAQLFAGILLQHKYSTLVGGASIVDVGLQIGTTIGLLHTSLSVVFPVMIPTIALYLATSVRLTILLAGFFKFIYPKQPITVSTSDGMMGLTVRKVLWFWWPLALVRCIQILSRPICNVLVARDLDDPEATVQALAVLTVTYPVAQVVYQWLNELKTLAPTFLKRQNVTTRIKITPRHIAIFNVTCMCISFSGMLILFWIPGIAESFLTTVLRIDEVTAALCVVPLKIFSFMPFAVTLRAHVTSWLLLWQQTKMIAPSAVVRLVVLVVSLLTFPMFGLHGAQLGITALLCSFSSEALTVLAGTIWIRHRRRIHDRSVMEMSTSEITCSDKLMVEAEERETAL